MKKVKAKDYLGKNVFIKIDRPLGSKHPKYDFIYESLSSFGYSPLLPFCAFFSSDGSFLAFHNA